MESQLNRARAYSILPGLLAGIVGVLVVFRKLWGQDLSRTLWADNYDARLLHWIAGWGYKALAEHKSIDAFWNAPSFFPYANSLAFSDSLLSAQILYTPLRWLGIDAFAALYLTLAGICIAACLLSSLALSRIGLFSTIERALIIYVAHFGLSIAGFLPHYQLFGFQFAVPFFLFLFLVLRDWKGFDLVLSTLCFCLGSGIATYLAPMLTSVSVVLSLFWIIPLIRKREFLESVRGLSSSALLISAGLLGALVWLQLLPYTRTLKGMQPQSFDESALYSAKITSFVTPAFGGNSHWYSPRDVAQFGAAERAFFPGHLVAYAAIFFLFLWLGKRKQIIPLGAELARGVDRDFIRFQLALLLISLVLAFGPYIAPYTWMKLPFYFMTWLVPGLERVRAPGRFGILTGLPAICLALCLLKSLTVSINTQRKITLAFAVLVGIETLPFYRVFTFDRDPKGVYHALAELLPPGAPLMELPVAGGDFLRTVQRTTEQLHGTLIHGGKVMVGYGASNTPEATALAKLDLQLQRGKARPKELANFTEQHGISWMLIHLERYGKRTRSQWRKFFKTSGSWVVVESDERILIARKQ